MHLHLPPTVRNLLISIGVIVAGAGVNAFVQELSDHPLSSPLITTIVVLSLREVAAYLRAYQAKAK